MHQLSIPAFYYPSTIIFVNDNYDFMLNLVLDLDEALAYRIFDSAFDALDTIHKTNVAPIENSLDKLELSSLYQQIYNARRFAEISVVIADYAMSGMDGLHFFKKIANSSIKKILLVDEFSIVFAKKALKEGLIDCYVEKNNPNVAETIRQNINKLQWQYFHVKSEKTIQRFKLTPPTHLTDAIFINFFNQLNNEQRIVEHYLMDDAGNFVLFDEDANHRFLLVKTEKEIIFEQSSLAHGAQKLWSPCDTSFALNEVNDEIRFYTHLSTAELCPINKESICSYHQYLDALDYEELFSL